MIKRIAFVFLLCLLYFPPQAAAKTMECEAVYTKAEGETKSAAEHKVMQLAETAASEKLGIYIRQRCRTVNYKLTDKEIEQVTAYVMKIKKKEFTWQTDDKFIVHCRLLLEFDDDIDKYIRSEIKNNRLEAENRRLKAENEYLQQMAPQNTYVPNQLSKTAFNEGKLWLTDNNYHKAAKCFRASLEADNNNLEAWENYFECLLKLGNGWKCSRMAKNLIKLQPNNANAWYYLGSGHLISGIREYYTTAFYTPPVRYGKRTLEALNRATSLGVDKPDVYSKLALAYTFLKEYDLARYNYRYGLNSGNRGGTPDPYAWYMLGKMCERQHRYGDAFNYYYELMKKYPEFLVSRRELSYVLLRCGETELGREYWEAYCNLRDNTDTGSDYEKNDMFSPAFYGRKPQVPVMNKGLFKPPENWLD